MQNKSSRHPVQIMTLHLILRTPLIKDCDALKTFEEHHQLHFAPWEPTKHTLSTLSDYQNLINTWQKEYDDDRSIRFFIFKKEHPSQIIGMCNYTQIFHGAFQACYLGYKIDPSHEGKGLMFEALQSSIRYIFEELHLHRIMANYMPINARSAKLLKRLGFIIEGYAKNYLLINHQWEDHVLTALSLEEWKKSH